MEPDDLERLVEQSLSEGLARYGSAEPRPDLENRVFARLRAEQSRMDQPRVRLWQLLTATAVTVVIAGVLLVQWSWRSPRPRSVAREGRSAVVESIPGSSPGPTDRAREKEASARQPAVRPHWRAERRVKAPRPRRDQFPSPAPLSEQEQILARYVSEFPGEAVLVARAQTEMLQREELEETGIQLKTSEIPEPSHQEP